MLGKKKIISPIVSILCNKILVYRVQLIFSKYFLCRKRSIMSPNIIKFSICFQWAWKDKQFYRHSEGHTRQTLIINDSLPSSLDLNVLQISSYYDHNKFQKRLIQCLPVKRKSCFNEKYSNFNFRNRGFWWSKIVPQISSNFTNNYLEKTKIPVFPHF